MPIGNFKFGLSKTLGSIVLIKLCAFVIRILCSINDDVREAQLGPTQNWCWCLFAKARGVCRIKSWILMGPIRHKFLKQSVGWLRLDWLYEKKIGLPRSSYHTCHIYHILFLNMTHIIGMTLIPYKQSLLVRNFLVSARCSVFKICSI